MIYDSEYYNRKAERDDAKEQASIERAERKREESNAERLTRSLTEDEMIPANEFFAKLGKKK